MEDGEGGKRDGRVTEAMDCFSVGCVIAELFLEGAPLFKLSQIFQYREGEFNVDHTLHAIEDEGIQASAGKLARSQRCSYCAEFDHTDDSFGTLRAAYIRRAVT